MASDRLEKVLAHVGPGSNTFREYPMLLNLNGTRMTGSIYYRLQLAKMKSPLSITRVLAPTRTILHGY